MLTGLAERVGAGALGVERGAAGEVVALVWTEDLRPQRLAVVPELWAWPVDAAVAYLELALRAQRTERLLREQARAQRALLLEAGHTTRTALSVTTVSAEIMLEESMPPDAPDLIRQMVDSAERARKALAETEAASAWLQEPPRASPTRVPLAPILALAIEHLRARAAKPIEMRLSCPDGLALDTDPILLEQLVGAVGDHASERGCGQTGLELTAGPESSRPARHRRGRRVGAGPRRRAGRAGAQAVAVRAAGRVEPRPARPRPGAGAGRDGGGGRGRALAVLRGDHDLKWLSAGVRARARACV